MKKTLAAVLALILVALSSFAVCATDTQITGANWMSAVDGSVPVTKINMPGTHDSLTKYIGASLVSKTQSLSVSQQLFSGVRYFDMRLNISGDEIIGFHGILRCKSSYGLFAKDLTAGEVVEDCKSFLKSNPGETVLFLLKQEGGEDSPKLFSLFYEKYIAQSPEAWFTENRIPSLDEVRGRIVLLRACQIDSSRFDDTNSGLNFTGYPYISSTDMNDFRLCPIDNFALGTYAFMYVQDSYKLSSSKKIEVVRNFLDSDLDSNDFNICCTNTIGGNTPLGNSSKVNGFLMSYPFESGKTYGIIVSDFTTKELCERVYMTNAEIMTETAVASSEIPENTESYGFLGKFLEAIRAFLEKIVLLFSK